jgi:hypothetical protein
MTWAPTWRHFLELGFSGGGVFLDLQYGTLNIIFSVIWYLGPVYTTVEKASGRSRMLGQDMVI